jgi:hypothetical protein
MFVTPALTTDYKKILQPKFTFVQEDEFYEIIKNVKNIFEYKLKDRYVHGLKDLKKNMENRFGIENKLSLDFILNKNVDIEKRLSLSEYKKNKYKKKINKITNDLYETEDYEDKTIDKQPIDKHQNKVQPIIIDEDFESKLKGIIENNNDIEKQSDNQQVNYYRSSFKLILKRRK